MELSLRKNEKIEFDHVLLDAAVEEQQYSPEQLKYFLITDQGMFYAQTYLDGLNKCSWKQPKTFRSEGQRYEIQKSSAASMSYYGETVEWQLPTEVLHYPAYWIHQDLAASFGVVWLKEGEYVEVEHHQNLPLQRNTYHYGVFAGYWHPYISPEIAGTHEISNRIITDLECHDFPHIFASIDADAPLVITVGRVDHRNNTLTVADLWIPFGTALYVPPRKALASDQYWYLHNNRNAAHACFGHKTKKTLQTQTVLQTEKSYTYWFWNDKRTEHEILPLNPTKIAERT